LGDFHDLPRWRLRRFFAQARAFQQHLQSRGVKRVFLVNAYSNPDLVLGAKQAGARVIELQHGFISPMHPAYSYPKRFKSAVLPDEVLVWGEHWRQQARLPRNTKVRVLGAVSQFQETRAALSKLERGAAVRRVLFTSQGAVAEELLGMAMEFARALPEFEIIYRLHPNENLADYERLLKAGSQPQNLSLSHREPRFLDLLLAQPIVVGGFSTTLFEAVGLGLKVIALPLAGREHLASAVAAGDIQLLTERHPRAETIRNIIASASAAKNPQLYYSSPRLPYFLR
jgi:hypothetical protein